MGSARQALTFIFDTGSSWLWIPSDACPKAQCTGTTYHYGKSSTYSATAVNQTVTYGKGQVQGYVVSDQVGLVSDGSVTATSSKFLSIFTATDISGISSDGLLGLSPTFMASASSGGELLMTSLVRTGVVSKKMFSMYLATYTKQSKIFFGGWNDTYVTAMYPADQLVNKTVSDLVCWVSLIAQNYWQVKLSTVTVSGTTNITLSYNAVVLDSGSSMIYVPTNDYN